MRTIVPFPCGGIVDLMAREVEFRARFTKETGPTPD